MLYYIVDLHFIAFLSNAAKIQHADIGCMRKKEKIPLPCYLLTCKRGMVGDFKGVDANINTYLMG